MLNGHDADEARRAVPYVRYGQPEYEEYEVANKEIENRFEQYLHSSYLSAFPQEAHKVVYERAYSDGHHAGFAEVETYYQEAAEVLIKIFSILSRSEDGDLLKIIKSLN